MKAIVKFIKYYGILNIIATAIVATILIFGGKYLISLL